MSPLTLSPAGSGVWDLHRAAGLEALSATAAVAACLEVGHQELYLYYTDQVPRPPSESRHPSHCAYHAHFDVRVLVRVFF